MPNGSSDLQLWLPAQAVAPNRSPGFAHEPGKANVASKPCRNQVWSPSSCEHGATQLEQEAPDTQMLKLMCGLLGNCPVQSHYAHRLLKQLAIFHIINFTYWYCPQFPQSGSDSSRKQVLTWRIAKQREHSLQAYTHTAVQRAPMKST